MFHVHGWLGAELAEHSQQHGSGDEDCGPVLKAPQEAVKVVLMPDGGYAVAVEVQPTPSLISVALATRLRTIVLS